MSDADVPLFWHCSDNFGDALAPWIVQKVTGRSATFAYPNQTDRVPYLVTGSIFGHAVQRGIVWGAGCAYEAEFDPAQFRAPAEDFKIIATRGPLTAQRVRAAGHAPVTFGDPGLLLSRWHTPQTQERHAAGIICSWVDFQDVQSRYAGVLPVISASTPIETVIDTISSWDVVVSSCLHGLVAAVAYGKPIVWAKFSDRMLGDGFKFRDFFATFDEEARYVEWPSTSDIEAKAKLLVYTRADELFACCPFRGGA